MMPMKVLTLLVLLISPEFSLSHGEDRLGPHGGIIRMPGPFHTEVVLQGKVIKVYLLDMNFKNPSIQNSQLSLILSSSQKEEPLSCTPSSDHFVCPLKSGLPTTGVLKLKGQRQSRQGQQVRYPLKDLLRPKRR